MYKDKAFLTLTFDDSSEMAPAMEDCCEFISRARDLILYVGPA